MIRAHVADADFGRTIAIAILDDGQAMPKIMRVAEVADDGQLAFRWADLSEGVAYPVPTLTLGHLEGRALLDALADHYKGSSDVQQLRRDLEFERSRSDRLIDGLISLSKDGP